MACQSDRVRHEGQCRSCRLLLPACYVALAYRGHTITRAIQSRSWPASSANLEYAAVWGTVETVSQNLPRVADDIEVRCISTLLEPAGRVAGLPSRLAENGSVAHIGCLVLGMGFTIRPELAAAWVEDEPRVKEVVFPYLNGEDPAGSSTSPTDRLKFPRLTSTHLTMSLRTYGRNA